MADIENGMVLPESKIEFRGPFDCPEEAPVGHCAMCGEPIYKGDIYYDIYEDMICEECISGVRRHA